MIDRVCDFREALSARHADIGVCRANLRFELGELGPSRDAGGGQILQLVHVNLLRQRLNHGSTIDSVSQKSSERCVGDRLRLSSLGQIIAASGGLQPGPDHVDLRHFAGAKVQIRHPFEFLCSTEALFRRRSLRGRQRGGIVRLIHGANECSPGNFRSGTRGFQQCLAAADRREQAEVPVARDAQKVLILMDRVLGDEARIGGTPGRMRRRVVRHGE